MDEHEDRVDDEEVDDDADEADEAEVEVGTKTAAANTPRAGDEEVESIQDILVKQEARAEEDDDDDSVLSLSREERLEPLAVKVVPPQPTEFICKNCYLVKHRSQLKDKTRMLCRDCA
ncbi:MAG: DUF4193 family protein [Actinomycetota bacterium]